MMPGQANTFTEITSGSALGTKPHHIHLVFFFNRENGVPVSVGFPTPGIQSSTHKELPPCDQVPKTNTRAPATGVYCSLRRPEGAIYISALEPVESSGGQAAKHTILP